MKSRCYLRGKTPLGLFNTVIGCLFNRVLVVHRDKKSGRVVALALDRAEFWPKGKGREFVPPVEPFWRRK